MGPTRVSRTLWTLGALAVLALGGAAAAVALYERGLLRVNYPSRGSYPVRGVDVSHHQGAVDWAAVRAAGIHFAFIKASEGADHRDREFERNWSGARSAGVARGAYHFFTFCTPGEAQAAHFIATLGGSFGELPPVADVEFSGNCRKWESIEGIREELRAFLARIETAAGVRPLLYFTRDAHERILDGHFDAYPVWPRSVVLAPSRARFGAWLFWQFADNGRVPGVGTLVDLNVFRGSRGEFESLVRVAPPDA
jgi:lysozyme